MNKTYSLAIRTLGRAGEKYQALLDSINAQTIKANKVLVYIPDGYDQPKETIGIEQIVLSGKGMITQRSQPFTEIDTDFVLFCDDDMYLPPTLVENLFAAIEKENADCVSPNCYPLQGMSMMMKLMVAVYNSSLPRKNDNWALKVKRDAGYSYNNDPKENVLPTQTAAGACIFCKMNVFRAIHFEDERWLDTFPFAALEDQLFHYKLYISGYKGLMYYNSGIEHLDARSATRPDNTRRMYFKQKSFFVVWYRTIYKIRGNSGSDKLWATLAYSTRMIVGILSLFINTVRYRKINYLVDYFRGIIDGYKYVHSEEYRTIPPYDKYVK